MRVSQSNRLHSLGEWRRALAGLVLALALPLALPAAAQDDLEDVFGGLGTDASEEGSIPARPGEGTVSGRVFDGETGVAVQGATVILGRSGAEDQAVQVTGADGGYEFPSVPPGLYEIQFVKSGYRASTMTDFEVVADQLNQADFPLPPVATDTAGGVLELEPFVATAAAVGAMLTALELRVEADQVTNIMSDEDLSRFAASDVAEALRRVSGVNIVEGQFAIIRGLEDRYSSTLFNGAPLPSPDPDRQSVQLDLFPAEVVDNLVVAKSFAPELPSNSSGGSIDILTQEYPEEWTFEVKAKGGVNENAWDEFLELRTGRNPIPKEIDGTDTREQEYGGSLGGRQELFGREFRLRGLGNWQTDYGTREGWKEARQPRNRAANAGDGDLAFKALTLTEGRFDRTQSIYQEQLTFYGGAGFDLDEEGLHKLDFAWFHTRKEQEFVQQDTNGYLPGFGYLAPGGPVDQAVNDGVFAEPDDFGGFDEPGFFSPNFPAGNPTNQNANSAWFVSALRNETERVDRGALWFSSFGQNTTLDRERKLNVYQLNGSHEFSFLDGFELSWAGNRATTEQDEQSRSLRHWYEPCGYQNFRVFNCSDGGRIPIPTVFPVTVQALGEGFYFAQNSGLIESGNDIDEEQWFARVDAAYEREFLPWLSVRGDAGVWWEKVERDVDANFLQRDVAVGNPDCNPPGRPTSIEDVNCFGEPLDPTLLSLDLVGLGDIAFNQAFRRDEQGLFVGATQNQNETDRDILAFALGSKATLWEDLDVLAGLRIEKIHIESTNDPFQVDENGEPIFFFDGSPDIFPRKYLFFDRFDNSEREFEPREPPFNDEFLGVSLPFGDCRARNPANGVPPPPGPAPGLEGQTCVDLATRREIGELINGEIKETKYLPSFGLTWRALPGLTLRGAYSQTVARPSSRELGYYVSFDPNDDEFVVGNPQLELSDVESVDLRAEYVFGDSGDLFAVSGFYKKIEKPIESVILRDAAVVSDSASAVAEFRTFFNNDNDARLLGVEVEGRKALDFIPYAGFLRYFSLGGNFTYIDAKVDRGEGELLASETFFAEGQTLRKSRRLFGQPEWIANADISFDQPDWGTQVTLAFFAISDVLDALGTGIPSADGNIRNYTLDRYVDNFHQLDLVASQELGWGFSLKGTAKNLTDSQRGLTYDSEHTSSTVAEQRFKLGRDYSIELKFTYVLGGD